MNKSGILILDKPVDKSSAFIARLVGRKLGCKKVGHLGTLDPFASGVLPIALNDATKLVSYISPKQKIYLFEMVFGKKTDSGDIFGKVIETSDFFPQKESLIQILPSFLGESFQTPPAFSALKIQGRKAYELARQGKVPKLKPRKIKVFSIKYHKQTEIDSHLIETSVSPGTYIRALAEDIASSIGAIAFVKSLRRIQDGMFSLDNAITLDELEKNNYNAGKSLRELEDVLDDIPVVFIKSQEVIENLRNGRKAFVEKSLNGLVALSSKTGFFAIGEMNGQEVTPKRIIRQNY